MENDENIVWKYTLEPHFDVSARVGYSTTSEEIGTYYGDKKLARFRVWEAYLGSNGIRYKITHQSILPL
jgi:hypothetical protein